jgi:carbon-monoxide dehydrogenase large subunit
LSTHAFHGRQEDGRLITGRGRYTADHNLPGQLYAVFLRSDRAHAEIRSIDTRAALAMPGVRAILTGDDVQAAGLRSLPTQLAVKGRDGADLIKPHRPVLAQGVVRFVGECVACVVAETRSQAQDAAEAIGVDYRDLPIVTHAVDALASGAPQLHPNVPANRVFDFAQGDEAKTAAAFQSAANVVRLTLHNNRAAASPMEPRAALAAYDATSDRYTLYSVTQGVNGLRTQVSGVLGITDDRLDVIAHDVGGGFGVRGNVYPEPCAVLLAAKKTGHPVKWTSSRSEAFLSDEQGRDVLSFGELALDRDGRFLALRYDFITNLGAYCAPAGPFINMRVTTCITGVYDVPTAYGRNQFVLTNTAPMAAYRGAGRPIMSSILERLVTHAARELGMDEAELRRKNMIPRTKFPYSLVNGYVYDCGDPQGVLDDALKASRWADRTAFDARRAAARSRGRLLGRGLATAIEPTGAGNAPDQVDLQIGDDGRIAAYAVSHSSGQGHETAFAEIVAQVLGVNADTVELREGDHRIRLQGNNTGGLRSTHGAGSALQVAAREVAKKGLPHAAEALEAAESDIEFAGGAYRINGTDRRITFTALAKRLATKRNDKGQHPLDTRAENKSGSTYPNGCHIAEVEIDPQTGVVEVVGYLACDDAGTIINHTLVEGQMYGGLTQGIGQVLLEHVIYEPASGQLLSGSYMDYAMPRADLLGRTTVMLLDHPVPTDTNPLGAKGVGESGVTGSLPTLMNAITDALAQVGVRHLDMPATPGRVWAAIEAAKAGKPAAMAIAQR